MNKIYLYCVKLRTRNDVVGYALAEDGVCITSHLSSDKSYSMHDLGLTSDWKHELYRDHYPDGFDLEWVDEPSKHEGWKKAFDKNKRLSEEV